MDMEDRVFHLEQRLQLQEDEIQLLKAALADALRRLGYCEEQSQMMQLGGVHAPGRRPLATTASAAPTKGEWGTQQLSLWNLRQTSCFCLLFLCVLVFIANTVLFCCILVRQLLQALPSKPLNNGYPQQKRLLSSPCSPKKEVLQSIKRYMEKKIWFFKISVRCYWHSDWRHSK